MGGPARGRAIRAVYVPAGGEDLEVAWREVAAPAAGGAWTLTVYPSGPGPPRRTTLTAAELRAVVRRWGQAARQGRGTLRIG